MNLFERQEQRDTDIEDGHVDTGWGGEDGMN